MTPEQAADYIGRLGAKVDALFDGELESATILTLILLACHRLELRPATGRPTEVTLFLSLAQLVSAGMLAVVEASDVRDTLVH